MDDILTFIRTSLVKTPEEWTYEGYFQSSGSVFSTMNLFFHTPTEYILIFIHIPTSEDGEEVKDLYYVQLLEYEDYLNELEENDGAFFSEPDFLNPVHPNSVIVKTLLFIKHLHVADEKIIKYSKFKDYVRELIEINQESEG